MKLSSKRIGTAVCVGAALVSASPGAVAATESTPGLYVLSSADKALNASGGSVIESLAIEVSGTANFSGGSSYIGPINTGSPVADPLAALPAPTWDPADDLGTADFDDDSNSVTPGFYSGGISASGCHVDFAPGVYVLGGEGLNISGGGSIAGDGVTIYILDGAKLTLSGGSTALLTAPTSGTYTGVSMFQSRTNANKVVFSGGSGVSIAGAIYVPAAEAVLSGGSGVQSDAPVLGSVMVADEVTVSGGGYIRAGWSDAPVTTTLAVLYD